MMLVAIFFLFNSDISAQKGSMPQLKSGKYVQRAVVRKLYTSYFASLLLSGCIGAATGTAVRYVEKQFNLEASKESPMTLLLMLFGWALESELRNDIIVALQKNLDAYNIGHKKGLMFKSAWISSWMTYLNM